MIDAVPSSDRDDPFDILMNPDSAAAPVQHSSRRELREAAARRGSARVMVPPGGLVSIPVPTLASSIPVPTGPVPRSRRLRPAENALVRANTRSRDRRHPISVLAAVAAAGGLFVVAGLPAYGLPDAASASKAASSVGQSLSTGGDAQVPAAARDGYRATTQAQLAEMSRDALRAQNNQEYLASGARQLGDDYPWPYEISEWQGGALSPLNYYYRQCTDFVAWRINRDAGSFAEPFKWVWSTMTPTGGNASQWKYAWQGKGWPVSNTPIVGSVAWFGWSNHVAYVKSVLPGGMVLIEEYNYVPNVYSQRTIPASSVEAFLYPPT